MKLFLVLIINSVVNLSVCRLNAQNKISCDSCIELDGYVFKHIPYHLRFHSNSKFENLKIESQTIQWQKSYNSKNELIFKIAETNYGYLQIYDTVLNKGIKLHLKGKNLPPSVFIISNNKRFRSGETISKTNLLKGEGFICIVLNFDGDIKFKVANFDLVYLKGNTLMRYHSKGSQFTDEQKNVIKMIKQKTILVFDNIIIEDYNKEIINVEPFVLYIDE